MLVEEMDRILLDLILRRWFGGSRERFCSCSSFGRRQKCVLGTLEVRITYEFLDGELCKFRAVHLKFKVDDTKSTVHPGRTILLTSIHGTKRAGP